MFSVLSPCIFCCWNIGARNIDFCVNKFETVILLVRRTILHSAKRNDCHKTNSAPLLFNSRPPAHPSLSMTCWIIKTLKKMRKLQTATFEGAEEVRHRTRHSDNVAGKKVPFVTRYICQVCYGKNNRDASPACPWWQCSVWWGRGLHITFREKEQHKDKPTEAAGQTSLYLSVIVFMIFNLRVNN